MRSANKLLTTEKHVFLPQKGPYLPNRPNRKRAWDSVTRRVWVYREKFNIDFWFQNFFLTSQHVLGLPKKIWEKNSMLKFSGWSRRFVLVFMFIYVFPCAYVYVCISLYLCLCLFVSAPSRLDLRVRWRLQNLNEGRFLRTRVVMAAAHRNRALQKWNHHSYRTIKQSSHRKPNGKSRRKHWLHNYSTTCTCLCLCDYVDICKYNAIKCSCATDVWSPRWQ